MNQPLPAPVEGLVNLFKPPGTSSAYYVYRLRRVFDVRKIGHAGTLDPFADGVLLACVGRATKLVERLMDLPKHYWTTFRLGVTNETFDPERPFLPRSGVEPPPRPKIEAALSGLVGEIDQAPPVFSAVKINGIPSYRHARRGRRAEPPPRPVRIDRIEILDYQWPRLSLEIRCGRGAYIRAIARDLGRLLETGACCETLTRTAVGPFTADDAVNLDTASDPRIRSALLPIQEVRRRIATP